VREAFNFERFMIKNYHFELIRQMVMYSKAYMSPSKVHPTWAMFCQMVTNFNNNMASKALQRGMTQILDEYMSSYNPRNDKRGDVFNIFCVSPSPYLGTEFKMTCDASTRVIMWAGVQEGKTAMIMKSFSRELGSTCATVVRAMESIAIPSGKAFLGKNWFALVKVWKRMHVWCVLCER
jgi:hypothetical protein